MIESDKHWESKILRVACISEKIVASSPPFVGSFSVKSVRSLGRSFFSVDGDYLDNNGNCQDPGGGPRPLFRTLTSASRVTP